MLECKSVDFCVQDIRFIGKAIRTISVESSAV